MYLATVNGLYQLNTNLKQIQTVRTGPQEDSHNCGPGVALTPEAPAAQRCKLKPTNAVNKALVIDKANNRVIVCSNLYQVWPACVTLDLLSRFVESVGVEVVHRFYGCSFPASFVAFYTFGGCRIRFKILIH